MEVIALLLVAVGAFAADKQPQDAFYLLAAAGVFSLVYVGNQIRRIAEIMMKGNSK